LQIIQKVPFYLLDGAELFLIWEIAFQKVEYFDTKRSENDTKQLKKKQSEL
jgi:hypothetical protein